MKNYDYSIVIPKPFVMCNQCIKNMVNSFNVIFNQTETVDLIHTSCKINFFKNYFLVSKNEETLENFLRKHYEKYDYSFISNEDDLKTLINDIDRILTNDKNMVIIHANWKKSSEYLSYYDESDYIFNIRKLATLKKNLIFVHFLNEKTNLFLSKKETKNKNEEIFKIFYELGFFSNFFVGNSYKDMFKSNFDIYFKTIKYILQYKLISERKSTLEAVYNIIPMVVDNEEWSDEER